MKGRKLSKLKLDIGNLDKMKPKVGSVSGALAKKIRNHVRKFKLLRLKDLYSILFDL